MRHSRVGQAGLPLLALATLLLFALPASAQYFGRNKVQYRSFKYEVLKTAHFDVYYYAPGRAAAEDAGRKAERWYARLTKVFQHRLSGTQPLIVYLSHPDFEQTNVVSEEIDEGTGGFTDVFRRRIVMPLGASPAESDHVVGHELVHAFQFDVTTSVSSQGGIPGAIRLPLWFIEGMAEYLTVGPVDTNTSMWLRDAVAAEKLPRLKDLEDPEYFPYRWGQAFWAYVTGRWGDRVVGDMLRVASGSGDVNEAIQRVLEVKPDELSAQWQQAIRDAYKPVALTTRSVTEVATAFIKSESDFGSMNLAPALSPDGTRMAYLSQRDLFSIDLYVSNTDDPKSARKLTRTAVDPHFSSIGFINGSGAWAPDNRRFAFAAMAKGTANIVIDDVAQGVTVTEISFPQVGEIFNLSWSPDGKSLVFSAHTAGFSDLYLYDLEAKQTRRLTDDRFADLQPAWSPDGKTIAFVTDRFSTTLANLQIGNYRLGLWDVASGAIREVPGLEAGKSINPQWSPDGRSLSFLSDRNGITNLYRIDLATGEQAQLTNLFTGISGITGLSPAMSVASGTGRTVFAVRERGDYNIYTLKEGASGTPPPPAQNTAAMLPPMVRVPGQVMALNADPTTGLPAPTGFKNADYQAKLQLDGVSQPSVAFGVDRFGTYAGGGVTLLWSDMMGDYSLATGVQMNSALGGGSFADTLKDTAVFVGFQNLKRRLNWGLSAQQVPYLSGGFSTGYDPTTGLGVEDAIIYRQIDRAVAAVAAYPLNRSQRIEFSAGFNQVSFEQVLNTVYFDPVTGQTLGQDRTTTPLGSLHYGSTSAALVFDTTSFGATSPILGQRYRFEVTPAIGSVRFTNVLADFRRYFMPVSFYTIAVRGMHYGRYGRDADNGMLYPLYIGYPNMVRGYDVNSFDASDCTFDAAGNCPEFSRLVGSRIAVGNIELRFPLLRPFGASQKMYGPLPIEVALFADGGVAWDSSTKPSMFGGDRQAVGSAGIGFRLNLFGFAVAEIDAVKPFQRTNRGWMFQFSLSPGF